MIRMYTIKMVISLRRICTATLFMIYMIVGFVCVNVYMMLYSFL